MAICIPSSSRESHSKLITCPFCARANDSMLGAYEINFSAENDIVAENIQNTEINSLFIIKLII